MPCDNPNTLSKVLACSRMRIEVTLTHQIHFLFPNSYIMLHTGAVTSHQSPLVLSGSIARVSVQRRLFESPRSSVRPVGPVVVLPC